MKADFKLLLEAFLRYYKSLTWGSLFGVKAPHLNPAPHPQDED
jgi:hypothetical protein